MQEERLLSGRYRLEYPIGEGGMSIVWRAHDELLGRPVAVKVLADRYADDPRCRAGIEVEARTAARLSHRHVASVYDYGESMFDGGERMPYLVIELLSGQSLADLLALGAPAPHTALRVCAEVAEGLAAAHERGVVHRDVKPANVMLTLTGAKVFDFGIAAPVGQVDEPDADGHIMGTPSYLAPERLIGGPVVPATDVYALALLMFRLLTGEQPRAVGDAHSQPAPLPPMPGVPAEIIELYRRSVQPEPHRRPTATEAAAVLRAAMASPPDAFATVAFTQPSGPPAAAAIEVLLEPTQPASRTDVRPSALVAACLAVLAALALVVTKGPPGTVSPSQAARPVETMGQRPGSH